MPFPSLAANLSVTGAPSKGRPGASHKLNSTKMHSLSIIFASRPLWRVTFDVVTPESAESGDTARNGFLDSAGNEYAQQDFATFKEWQAFEAPTMSLREAAELCGCLEDSGSWLSECDGSQDYRTGEEMRRSIHPPRNISAASYARLCKALKVY